MASRVIGAVGELVIAGRERGGAADCSSRPGSARYSGGLRVRPNTLPSASRRRRRIPACVRFCDDDAAPALDPFDHWVRTIRHMFVKNRRNVGRANAGDIGKILDGDWQAAQLAGLCSHQRPFAAHQLFGM